MSELILIRHAATDMAGTLCGQSDPPLNALGKEQAIALAQTLRVFKFSRLYASNLQRALQTAQPIAELADIAVNVCSDLGEISFGDWEGRRWAQVREEYPGVVTLESSPGQKAPGGELFEHFRARVLRALQTIVTKSRDESVAIVTHLGVIRLALNEVFPSSKLMDTQQRVDYCSFYRVQISEAKLEPSNPQ